LIRETHDIRARENDVKVSLDSLKEAETTNDEKKSDVDKDALKKGKLNAFQNTYPQL
jgi:hypothetical protein